jgi:hypothetical protein
MNGSILGWTIATAPTFLVIGLPTLYVLVLTLTDDEAAFDRCVPRDIEQNVKLGQRAGA